MSKYMVDVLVFHKNDDDIECNIVFRCRDDYFFEILKDQINKRYPENSGFKVVDCSSVYERDFFEQSESKELPKIEQGEIWLVKLPGCIKLSKCKIDEILKVSVFVNEHGYFKIDEIEWIEKVN